MARPIVIGGQLVTTSEAVFKNYTPSPSVIPPADWDRIRPLAIAATKAADYATPWGALQALRYAAQYIHWAERQDIPLDLESLFHPDHVERFIGTQTTHLTRGTRGTMRAYLRKIGTAATSHAPWAPIPVYDNRRHLTAPYTAEQVAGYWEAVRSQATERRTRVLTVMLTLGLGAGLKPSELLSTTAGDVRRHPDREDLWAIFLPTRTVPVLTHYVPELRALCRAHPDGPLIGAHRTDIKDPLGVLRKGIEIPSWLPPLRAPVLRTTWMATVLQLDIRITEFMYIAGTESAKSLEAVAPYVPGRWADDTYLFKGAGL